MDLAISSLPAVTPSAAAIAAAVGLGFWGAWRVVSFFTQDADGPCRAALRAMPRDAYIGKTAWIVGASSGIGEALAYELASRGARLVLSARRVDKLRAVALECVKRGAPQAEVLEFDILDFAGHGRAASAAAALMGGRLDFVVNNAGRSQRALVERTDLQVDRDLFELNVLGPIGVTKAVLPLLLAQGGGCIATTSSIAGKCSSPCSATYSASKAAINAYMATVRMETGSRGVKVVNVCPGPVTSEITLRSFTGTTGGTLGLEQEATIKRMSAERCAALYAAAMWRGLPEVWVSPQPILLYTYLAQYLPTTFAALSVGAGRQRVEDFKRGVTDAQSLQNPLKTLFGVGGGGASRGGKRE